MELLVGVAPPIRITSAASSLEDYEQHGAAGETCTRECLRTKQVPLLLGHGGMERATRIELARISLEG